VTPGAGGGTGRPAWFERLADGLTHQADQNLTPFRNLPPPPENAQPRHSAVLALFGSGPEGDGLVLTQRASTLRSHPGQVSFPGGRIEDTDAGPEAAALREAQEETGLDPASVHLGALGPRLYLSVTDYWVSPVLGWWERPHELVVGDPAEVERVGLVALDELIDPANRFSVTHPSSRYIGPAFAAGGFFIWGFTAGVITWMLQLAGVEREWDAGMVRRLPDLPIRTQRDLDEFLQVRAGRADTPTDPAAAPGGSVGGPRVRHEELGMAE